MAAVLPAVGCLRLVAADSPAVACPPPGAVDFLVVGCRTAEGSVVVAAAAGIAKTGSSPQSNSGAELKFCSLFGALLSASPFGFWIWVQLLVFRFDLRVSSWWCPHPLS